MLDVAVVNLVSKPDEIVLTSPDKSSIVLSRLLALELSGNVWLQRWLHKLDAPTNVPEIPLTGSIAKAPWPLDSYVFPV